MHKYLEKESEISFDKIFNQILGEYNIYICIHNIFFLSKIDYNNHANVYKKKTDCFKVKSTHVHLENVKPFLFYLRNNNSLLTPHFTLENWKCTENVHVKFLI